MSRQFLTVLFVMLMSICGFAYIQIGVDYETIGYGLHPLLAYPLAIVSFVLGLTVPGYIYRML